ncbi:MAG: peptide deformylase [Clostridiaceae bacterium]|jgi:peptide deformylase|nr:peptide deformylase [Clostridiaceae bacterium]
MAVKKVFKYGEAVLREPAKEVHKVSKKIHELVQDLLDTMYAQNGVGLAAPQIGVSYRVFVIDTSANDEPLHPIVFINPKIIKKSGAMTTQEGCLSFPEAFIDVKRYKNVTVRALDINGRPFVIEAKDGTLQAKAIQHENDHLDGILFIDHCVNRFDADNILEKYNLPPVEVNKLISEPELENELKND